MRRTSRFLLAIAGLLLCLLLSPVFADAQWAVSPGALSDLHASSPEDGESEANGEEPAGEEDEAQAAKTEAEEEAEVSEDETSESEELGSATSTRSHRRGIRCVVPALQGESLSGARITLSKAHCKLGKVSEPHAHHGGLLLVVTQSQVAGRRLTDGTLIAVRLSTGGRIHRRR
jgi:hypothetical protein